MRPCLYAVTEAYAILNKSRHSIAEGKGGSRGGEGGWGFLVALILQTAVMLALAQTPTPPCCCAADDEEMKAMAQEEAEQLRSQLQKLEGELEILLLPRDPLDDRSIMLEVPFCITSFCVSLPCLARCNQWPPATCYLLCCVNMQAPACSQIHAHLLCS